MTDKIGEKKMYETMKSKFVGLGDDNTQRKEFIHNVRVDTYTALATNSSLVELLSVGLSRPRSLVKQDLIDKIARS